MSASGTPRTAPSTPGAEAAFRQAAISHRPDEGAGGIMDGDEVRRPSPASASRPFRTECCRLAPAYDRRRQVEAGNGRLVVRFVAATDHDLDPVDPGRRPKGLQGVAQDRLAGQKGILLGQGAAEAAAPAGSDDQGSASRHEGLDNIGLRGCALRTLARAAGTRYCSLNYCALHKMPIN